MKKYRIKTLLTLLMISLVLIGTLYKAINAEEDPSSSDDTIQLETHQNYSIQIDYDFESIQGVFRDDSETNFWHEATVNAASDDRLKIEVYYENSSIEIMPRHLVEGKYYVSVLDKDKNEHKYWINVTKVEQSGGSGQQGGGQNQGPTTFTYEGVNYQVGAANGSSDGATLHIDGGGVHDVDSQETQTQFFIGVGMLNDNGQITGSASQAIINGVLENLIVTSSNSSVVAVSDPTDYKFMDKTVEGGVDTKQYTLSFPNKQVGSYSITISFTFDGNTYNVNYDVIFRQTANLDVDVATDEAFLALSGNTVVEKLNTLFAQDADYNNTTFIDFVKARNNDREPDEDTELNILLTPDTTYSGLIVVNCPGYKINFRTKNSNAETHYDRPYNSANNNATISGGIVDNGGFIKIEDIDFVANEAYKTTYNDSSVAVGLCASMTASGSGSILERISDVFHVNRCSFTGYDYAILSSGMGLVSGINNCRFANNNVAICIDSQMNNYYSDSRYNIFITDNNDIAIYLKRRPKQSSALQFVYADNWFFGTGTDYKMGAAEDNSGVHFFINSYYGNTADAITNANVRGSRVIYEQGAVGIITTGPCIRYPESTNKYGFDIGTNTGSNKLHNKADMNLHVEDLRNNNVNIDIYDDGSGSDLGTLTFGGNN